MVLKSKTFDIFYNLYPLKIQAITLRLCFQATRRHLFTDEFENGRIFLRR